MAMTALQASVELRSGKTLNVDLDTAEEALALALPALFRMINPTLISGRESLARFRMLADNAGLPDNSLFFSSWFAIRALRLQPGDSVINHINCPVTAALLAGIGTSANTGGFVLRDDLTDPDAVSITLGDPKKNEAGAFATPGGTIRIPGSTIHSMAGTFAQALADADACPGTIGRNAYDKDPNAVIELDYSRPIRELNIESDAIHEDWRPEIAVHEDLKRHPSRLIQSATLATVEPPRMEYRPRLPRRVITSGFISDAQFEFIVAAGQAHSRHLLADPKNPTAQRERVGIYLADGTGAGKTNEELGVILDNELHGRRLSVLVLQKRRHLSGFLDTWAKMGRSVNDFHMHWDWSAEDSITVTKGIIVTTYSMLRDRDKLENFVRVNQLAQCLGRNFEGAIIFDEAQEMRNAAGDEDKSGGNSMISQQGLAGVELQDVLPDARIVYGSATGATDVHNLAYCTRLGLWGPGTQFAQRLDFISCFEDGNISDLEQVTLSLKASGVYFSRSLSFDGVEVFNLPVILTNEERATYNKAATLWARLRDTLKQNRALCGTGDSSGRNVNKMRKDLGIVGSVPYSSLNGMFESNRKRSMATMIASFKARGVIADAAEKIENGMSVVIQMQNTYEAQLNRALARCEDPNNIRIEPAELISFAERLPVHKCALKKIPDTRKNAKRNAVITIMDFEYDTQGNKIEVPEAVANRNRLVAEARQIQIPLPPLDQIMMAFGPAQMAEVTGRTRRMIPDKPYGLRDGATGFKVEDRQEIDRARDIQAFHDADKKILSFSTGAGGSSLSYHAKTGTKAGSRRRVHYLIQLGYRADEVTQGIGRTHRSDEESAPMVGLVTVDMPADRLYASRIVTALFKLGALTQGHRHANSNGMFDERDCMDGEYATGAWKDLREAIVAGEIEDYTWNQFMEDMGLDNDGNETKNIFDSEKMHYVLTDINRMINRVASLTDRRQSLIFDKLREFIDLRIEAAMAEGTYSAGPELLKAKSLKILTDRRIKTDVVHGGETRIVRLLRTTDTTHIPFVQAFNRYLTEKNDLWAQFMINKTTGKVCLQLPSDPIETNLGDFIPCYEIITPSGTVTRAMRIVNREAWKPATDLDNVEKIWNAIIESEPEEELSFVTLVSNALLPIWRKLQGKSARGSVYRAQTDEGHRIVGRPITNRFYGDLCIALDEPPVPDPDEIDLIMDHLSKGSTLLINDKFSGSMISGYKSGKTLSRLEIQATKPSKELTEAMGRYAPTLAGNCAYNFTGSESKLREVLEDILSVAPATKISLPTPKKKASTTKAVSAALMAA